MGRKSLMFNSEKIHQNIELARVYRPWEDRESHKHYFKEIDELYLPSKEKLLHLEEISTVLKILLAEVEISRLTRRWDSVLAMEERYPLFSNTMDHCFNVGWEFSKISLIQYQRDHEVTILTNLIIKEKPPLANNDYAKSVLLKAFCFSRKVPVRYKISLSDSQKYALLIDYCNIPNVIAQGTRQEMENCEYLHTKLVEKIRKNPRFKALVKQERKILEHLRNLEAETNVALSDPNFIHTTCLQCP